MHRARLLLLVGCTILLTMILSGCGTEPQLDEVDAAGTEAVVTIKPTTELMEALVGQWMPSAYCECLFQQRSAFACEATMKEIYTLFVERSGTDSLRWSYITTHEGGPEAILGYDARTNAFAHRPTEDEYLGFERVELHSIDDTTLTFSHDPKVAPQRFRRVRSSDALLNEALFSGDYLQDDDTSLVRFTPDGRISGPFDFSHYTVLTDFTEGLDDRDIVFLHHGNYDWDTNAFHYQHDGELLLLYPMVSTEEEYVYRMEDLKYRLQRTTH